MAERNIIILCLSGKLSHTNIRVLTRNYYRKEMLPERDRFDLDLAIQLAFGSSVGIIEKILACVQPELQAAKHIILPFASNR